MATHHKKEVVDEVHHNQILRELYLKELRTQKLYTKYHVNPLRKVHTITRKPMSWHDNLEEPADASITVYHHEVHPTKMTSCRRAGTTSDSALPPGHTEPPSMEFVLNEYLLKDEADTPSRFLNLIHHAAQGPTRKYEETQTESQEIGWDSEPLINQDRSDRRLNHFRVYNDITLYKAKMWSLGEDDRHK